MSREQVPPGTKENGRGVERFLSPRRGLGSPGIVNPSLKRWAIFGRSCGTGARRLRRFSVGSPGVVESFRPPLTSTLLRPEGRAPRSAALAPRLGERTRPRVRFSAPSRKTPVARGRANGSRPGCARRGRMRGRIRLHAGARVLPDLFRAERETRELILPFLSVCIRVYP